MVNGLFVIDFDGTLLGDDKRLASVDRDALATLRQRGVITAIATGRSIYSFKKIMVELGEDGFDNPFPVDYVIFSTGAGIMDYPACTILNKHSLAADDVITISKTLDGFSLDYMIHRAVPDTKQFIYRYCTGSNRDFQTRLDLYKDYSATLTEQNLESFGEATELLCIVEREKGDEIVDHLSVVFADFSVIKATSPLDKHSIWVEIFAKEVSKSKAVSWLAKEINVKQSQVCAVGNDYNDEDLLNWAGRGYLVANGPESLQTLYQIVASNNDGGVAEAAACWLGMKMFG